MLTEVDLNLYGVGVCYVKSWCPDSKRIASLLKAQPVKILFVDYDTNAIYKYISSKNIFVKRRVVHQNIEVVDEMPGQVPLLYLINKTTKDYDGPWTTHHGHSIVFKRNLKNIIKF
jgi:hypothetical protein